MAMILASKLLLYIAFSVSVVGNVILYNTQTMYWTEDRFIEELSNSVKSFCYYLDSNEIATIGDIERYDQIIRPGVGTRRDLSRGYLNTGGRALERAHYIRGPLSLTLYFDLVPIFVPGVLSFVPVEKNGQRGALVVGRGTFVGIPIVVFAFNEEIVHVSTSDEDALEYFITDWYQSLRKY